MKFLYEKINEKIHLVCQCDYETVNNYVYPMIMNNNIPGIIKPMCTQAADCNFRYVYDLSNMTILNNYLNSMNEDSASQLEKIYKGFEQLWNNLDAYMINERFVLWDFNYIYVDQNTGMPQLICIAVDSYISNPISRTEIIGQINSISGAGKNLCNNSWTDRYCDNDKERNYEGETTVLCSADIPKSFELTFGNKQTNIKKSKVKNDKRGRRKSKEGDKKNISTAEKNEARKLRKEIRQQEKNREKLDKKDSVN